MTQLSMPAAAARPTLDDLRVEPGLPTVVSPREGADIALHEAAPLLREIANDVVERAGGVLFTGFRVASIETFQRFAADFGDPLIGYEFASTPRSQVEGAVYTSTEYPPHRSIPLHNEQSYTREWPMRIWFHCALAARTGGATPIADSRAVYRALDPALAARFAERELLYVRNFGQGLDLPWQQAFGADDPREVERICAARGIDCEWREGDDGEPLLRTRERCQAVAHHPRTGELVWFNQANLFHLSTLDEDMQEALVDAVGIENVPRNVYYGDGAPLEPDALAEIRAVLDGQRIVFPWRTGDVLMLDNMLSAHARDPFEGPRKVVVAMARSHRETGGA
ncbi:taurine catabolism dioxygenase TauD, TfdA family protein [Burkholderia thailandensis USAMRU Malaysia |uniref:TauD/TfdA family dioxygenase n=1 Tax=Burkholderia thailandensis TaxID=57975 RepID=UPI0003EC7383|nr:TauD/TfdA family dioxygenase [Burkholderia thailandensis]AHI79143.1 taurine catabolism dioxygenase TauD, TfdA family protein [Burkholderia thailandensis E444]AIC87661.1 taurine catabolism dioxygenase TauD, TfdA family protein [Burkholderia thailandensis USAMRU Malaysia \